MNATMTAEQKAASLEGRTDLTAEQKELAVELHKSAPGNLTERAQRLLAARKTMAEVVAKVAEQNWGKGLDYATRSAVAYYLRDHALDVTEIDVLGGNLYRNSRYYIRRLSEMTEAGKIEYAKADHIHVDPRLDAIAADTTNPEAAAKAKAEISRRAFERIASNAPDKAAAICVFRVKLVGVAEEFSACKWAGNNTRTSDPVGEKFPVESSESRSARRCLRLVASQMPALKRLEDILDESAQAVSTQIIAAHAKAIEQQQLEGGTRNIQPASGDDPYGVGSLDDIRQIETVETREPAATEPAANETQATLALMDDATLDKNRAYARYEQLKGRRQPLDDDEQSDLAGILIDYPELNAEAGAA